MSCLGCCSQFDCCSHNVCLLASPSEIHLGGNAVVKKLRKYESLKWYFKQGGVVRLVITCQPAKTCFMEESSLFTDDAKRRLERTSVAVKNVCWLYSQKSGNL